MDMTRQIITALVQELTVEDMEKVMEQVDGDPQFVDKLQAAWQQFLKGE